MTMSKRKISANGDGGATKCSGETRNSANSVWSARSYGSTVFCALRLELLSVEVVTTGGGTRIFFEGVIEFTDATGRAGVTELFQFTDVTGQLSQAVWQQLDHFQQRLSSGIGNDGECTRVEIVASRACLRQPRAWVTKTKHGIAAATILEIDIEELDRARIPGHRWRVLEHQSPMFITASVNDKPTVANAPVGREGSPGTAYHNLTLH